MRKYEYIIHQIRKGKPFGEGDSCEEIGKLGQEGWQLMLSHEYVEELPDDFVGQLRVYVQFIFMREIPPEQFPS